MWGAILVLVVAVALLIYQSWRRAGRVNVVDEPNDDPDLYLREVIAYGGDQGHGNLMGIQPYMTPQDYESQSTFYAKLDSYMHQAMERDWLTSRSVVVLPEHVGTWLVVLGEKRGVFQAKTLQEAMKLLVLSDLPEFVVAWVRSWFEPSARDRVQYSLFAMKAKAVARAYQDVFGMLAREHDVTIVAGSTVLPDPRIVNGKLVIGRGPLYNVSVVFGPDGRAHEPLVRKAFPTLEELPFTACAPVDELPVYDLPIGRTAVLICADAWFPAAYDVIKEKQATVVIVPSFSTGRGSWAKPWNGYSGHDMPSDVERGDIARITLHEAWHKYAMAGRAQKAGIGRGLNVFLRGELWDMGSDGYPILIYDDQVVETRYGKGAAIVNVWL